MKITKVDTIALSIPFDLGTDKPDWGDKFAQNLDTLLIRVETDNGLVGWGDAFAYGSLRAVQAAVEDMIAPKVIGADARDIIGINHRLQQENHLWGRYGITLFAISGLDIALWDLAGKAANMPLVQLLGGATTKPLPAYASLFRYGDAATVKRVTAEVAAAGYEHVKLHEVTVEAVEAARRGGGDKMAIMVDTNCPWTPVAATEMVSAMAAYDPYWIEEPIFPPEDFDALARLRMETGVRLAAGENACTSFQFQAMFAAGAVDFAQPSVTKVGGITEFQKITALAETAGVQIMAHSPYFGPGFLATLQLAAALPKPGLIERFHANLAANLMGPWVDPKDGYFHIPDGPGLGADPDPDVIARFRVTP
jgi:L-alanine-DL-glutamate epimerase-like enolase superfamily enzyme